MLKKIVIIPDSFKGSLTSHEASSIMENSLKSLYPKASIIKIPISDGGEGFVDCFIEAMGGKIIRVKTLNPYQEPITSFFGMINDTTAVIEMAASAGLNLVKGRLNPSITTTFGVGELIIAAIKNGAKKIILGLGGSATNDAGVGMAQALGVKFFNQNNQSFLPVGATLKQISYISGNDLLSSVKTTEFITLCDVKNPLFGPMGAANVFAKQKGADEEMIKMLDENLHYYAKLLKKQFQFDANFEGAGAAGGMSVSAKLFLNAQIKSGIDTFLEMIDFDTILENTDLILTGEGKFDQQSIHGKVIDGLAKYAHKRNIPLYAIVGQIENITNDMYPKGLDKVIAIADLSPSVEEAIHQAPYYLDLAIKKMFTPSK
jgi:glycerate kinase